MKTEGELTTFYQQDLKPVLFTFEQRRKKILSRAVGFGMAAVALAAGVLLLPETVRVFAWMLLAGAAFWGWKKLTGNFVAEFKREVVARVVRFYEPTLSYEPLAGIRRSRFQGSGLFLQGIDRYRREDLVVGQIGDTPIRFSEVHAEYKTTTTDSKGRTRTQWHTIFKGLYFVADFNKEFQGRTVVLPDTAQRLFGFLGTKLQALSSGHGELVQLEDPEFEKAFVVYGSDQIEARYVLSLSLMRRILEFKKKSGKDIYLSFNHSEVHVAISMREDLFEPRYLSSLLDRDMVEDYIDNIDLAVGIVSDLNLNTRIWTKGRGRLR